MGWKSLATKLFLPLICFLVAQQVLTLFVAGRRTEARRDAQLERNAHLIANAIQQTAGVTGLNNTLQRIVNSLAAEGNVETISLMMGDPMEVVISSDHHRLGERFDQPNLLPLAKVGMVDGVPEGSARRLQENERLFLHGEAFEVWDPVTLRPERGVVIVEVNEGASRLAEKRAFWFVGLFTSGKILAFFLLITVLARRFLLSPVKKLTETISKRASGDKRAYVEVSSQDELGQAGKTLNQLFDRHEEDKRLLEESNQELASFAHIVSHDLKAPLRGIYNYSTFVEEDDGPSLSKESQLKLQTVRRLAQDMDHLLDTLLYTSQVGRTELKKKGIDLQTIAEEAAATLEAQIEEKQAKLTFRDPLPTIECDPTRAREVFFNLISNALKYNDKPNPEVVIGVEERNGKESLFVRDNGIGIKPDHQPKVFTIFKRLHQKEAYGGGSGSGLTIAKKIIDRHEGEIWVESEEGKGSTFYFNFG